MIAEKLLGLGYGAAAIGIDAAQIKGVLPLPLSLRKRPAQNEGRCYGPRLARQDLCGHRGQ